METVAVVDAYSTGRHLPGAFRRYGKRLVHVRSSPEIPEILRRSYRPEAFDEALPYEDAEATARTLRRYGSLAVLPGAESGVLFADELCRRLGLEWNVPELSLARRHKFEMIAALQRAGLPTADQTIGSDPAAIERWALERADDDWPIVLKPPMSTSSEDVYFCYAPHEIRESAPRILGKTNFLGLPNDAVVAQTFLEGPIYVVNSVSLDGRHLASDVWCFEFLQNERGSITFTNHYLLDPGDELFRPLVAYNERALDAVGIRNGPSHSELKATRRGVRLVETTARLMGATIEEEPFVEALGITQVDLTAMAVCDPVGFEERLREPYRLRKHLKIVWVHFPLAGTVAGDEGCRRLEELESFAGYFGRPSVGDEVRPSADTTGRGGFVYLLHEDRATVEREGAEVRALVEDCELFEIAPRLEPQRA